MRIAQAEYQIENWSKVLVAIGNRDKFNAKPELSPLSLKLGAQLQLKQWKQSIPTLESLIELQPEKDNWWRQLVGIQLRLERNRDALNTLALADLQGVELKTQTADYLLSFMLNVAFQSVQHKRSQS